jgi:hypothetical protein
LLIDRNNIEAKNTMKDLINATQNKMYVGQNSKNKEAKPNPKS